MYVIGEVKEVGITLNQFCLKSPLEQSPYSFVFLIEIHCIARSQLLHKFSDTTFLHLPYH